MGLTSMAIYAPGDTITSAWANILRTNFNVLDARTGGDPGASGKIPVSNGAASAVWTGVGPAVVAGLGFLPADSAGQAFIGPISASSVVAGAGGISSSGPTGLTDVVASGAVSAAQFSGGTIANGAMSLKGLSVGADGINSLATMTIGGQEVYWSGNPPPASSGGQLVGEIRLSAAASLTAAHAAGWLTCDGSAVSRTTHSALFTAIGTAFGVGNGSTTFNVPDLRDRFPLGTSGTRALASTGGAFAANLQHNHSAAALGVGGTLGGPTDINGLATAGGVNLPTATHTHDASGLDVTGSTDNAGSTTQDITPPYLAVAFIIYSGVPT